MKNLLRTAILLMAIILGREGKAQEIPVWKAADLQTAIDTTTVPTVINFWATFCKPCIAELPHFQAVADKYRKDGLRLVLVSLDLKEAYPRTVSAFVKKRKVTAPVVFLDETDADVFVPLVDKDWSGAIPASLFLDGSKNYRVFIEDELSRQKLEAEVQKMLQAPKA